MVAQKLNVLLAYSIKFCIQIKLIINTFLLLFDKNSASIRTLLFRTSLMENAPIKRTSTIFLQAVIILIGVIALSFILWEPQAEGVNAHATFFEIYFQDPFVAYMYGVSTLFFVALYQAFILLQYIAHNKVFTRESVKALRTIQYCGIVLATCIAVPVMYLFIVRPGDDIAGGVAMGLFIIFSSSIIATAAAIFAKLLDSAVEMKFENDLTV